MTIFASWNAICTCFCSVYLWYGCQTVVRPMIDLVFIQPWLRISLHKEGKPSASCDVCQLEIVYSESDCSCDFVPVTLLTKSKLSSRQATPVMWPSIPLLTKWFWVFKYLTQRGTTVMLYILTHTAVSEGQGLVSGWNEKGTNIKKGKTN